MKRSTTHNGKIYYVNRITGESVWEKPSISNEKIHAFHILFKHKDSRNPFSGRSKERIEISKDQAIKLAEETYEKLNYIANDKVLDEFKKIAKERSDCSSASKEGDLGTFPKVAFEEAAFKLSPGQISKPVFTDSGIHLIYRAS